MGSGTEAGIAVRPVYWVASYPKSGNTWIRAFLTRYVTGGLNLNEMIGTIDIPKYYYQQVSPLPLLELDPIEIMLLRNAVLCHITRVSEGRNIILKTHNAMGSLGDVILFPRVYFAGAVYVVRDPRDVVLSYARHTSQSIDSAIASMSNEYTCVVQNEKLGKLYHAVGTWSANVQSWVERSPAKIAVVRFEDMLTQPHDAFKGICDYLYSVGGGDQMEYDKDKMDIVLADTTFESLQSREKQFGFREKPERNDMFFKHGTAGRWKKELTKRQVRQIEKDHGEVMESMGYELAKKTRR